MKRDADQIAHFVEGLPRQCSLIGAREVWPKYLFRIDDVRNAAAILNRGAVLSRNRAAQLGVLKHDAAAPDVIGNSPDWIKEYVRFYFRPRTPTEYRSEGIRPIGEITMGAHRPVPVVLVFESLSILTATGTVFGVDPLRWTVCRLSVLISSCSCLLHLTTKGSLPPQAAEAPGSHDLRLS